MNDSARAQALIALVDAQRDARCGELAQAARRDAVAMLSTARMGARSRVHATVAEERALFAQRIASEEAKLATARRMRRQRTLQALLVQARAALPLALAARWGEPQARARWIEGAIAGAGLVLEPSLAWRIEVPASLAQQERDRAAASVASRGIAVTCMTDASLQAGLRVRAGKVLVDASAAGLLADTAAVEGRLVELLEAK